VLEQPRGPGSYRVLVVDDETGNARGLATFLAGKGCEVEIAATAADGILALSRGPVAVALVELALPDSSGLKLLSQIKERSEDTEVLLMAQCTSVDAVIQALRNGAYDYLAKPLQDLEAVWRRVEQAIEKHLLIAQNRSLMRTQEIRREELAEAVHRLSCLIEVGRRMNEFQSLSELLDFVIATAVEELDVARASIMLLDEKGRELGVVASRGILEIDPGTIRVPIGTGIAGQVAESGRPVLVNDADTDPRLGERRYLHLSGSFLSVPLVLGARSSPQQRILGVINVTNRRSGRALGEADLEFVTALAGKLSLALERTRHIEELRHTLRAMQGAAPGEAGPPPATGRPGKAGKQDPGGPGGKQRKAA